MFPPAFPSSQLGQLEREIDSLKSEIGRKANDYEVNTLRGKVDSLEHTIGELRSEIVSFRSELQELSQNISNPQGE